MNYKIYVIFHKDIHDTLYDKESLKHLVFVGVNDKIKKRYNYGRGYDIIYEYKLPYFDSFFDKYKESSAIYHIYRNKLYQGLDYIGFAQYDMSIKKAVFQRISDVVISDHARDFLFYSETNSLPISQSFDIFIRDFLINSYNAYFNTAFTFQDLQGHPWTSENFILCSTFIIPVKIYEKIMPWIYDLMNQYRSGIFGTWKAQELIERAYGLALGLEYLGGNLKPVSIPIVTSPTHKILSCHPAYYGLYCLLLDFTRPLRGRLKLRLSQWRLLRKKISNFISFKITRRH